MQTLTFDCEIGKSRDVVLRLPDSVTPGRHRIALVIDPPEQSEMLAPLAPIPDSVAPRTPLWAQLAALREQAEKDGVLPEPLSWDGVLAEVEHPPVIPAPPATRLDELFHWIDAQTPPPTIPLSAMDRDEIY